MKVSMNGRTMTDMSAGTITAEPPVLKRPSRVAKTADKPLGTVAIEIPELDLRTFTLKIVGETPLICHAWSQKAKDMILDKQMKKAKGAREAKDPIADYLDSLYWLSKRPAKNTEDAVKGAKFGFPTRAFKAAAVNAASFIPSMTKVAGRGAFHIDGELVEIKGTPKMREDMVRIAMGGVDIRYRGEFEKWSAEIAIKYSANVLSPAQIVNLFSVAGFSVGIGEDRPQRNGSHGMFRVARDGE